MSDIQETISYTDQLLSESVETMNAIKAMSNPVLSDEDKALINKVAKRTMGIDNAADHINEDRRKRVFGI